MSTKEDAEERFGETFRISPEKKSVFSRRHYLGIPGSVCTFLPSLSCHNTTQGRQGTLLVSALLLLETVLAGGDTGPTTEGASEIRLIGVAQLMRHIDELDMLIK